jgi:uncharacterized repeat protein (TIGR03803 family)
MTRVHCHSEQWPAVAVSHRGFASADGAEADLAPPDPPLRAMLACCQTGCYQSAKAATGPTLGDIAMRLTLMFRAATLAMLALRIQPSIAQAQTFSTVGVAPYHAAIGAVFGKIIYGTTAYGGTGNGTLFSMTTSGVYTLRHTFNGTSDGSVPNPELAIDKGGDVFGTAQEAGADNGGTFWKQSAGGAFSIVHAFGSVSQDGTLPLQGPTATSGAEPVLYATAASGAIGTDGNVFEITSTGTRYRVLHDFLSGSDGHCPFSGVARDGSGNIYGTTVGRGYGGNPNGSLWKITRAGTFSTLYVFKDSHDGEWPDQAPVADSAGNVYGTTHILKGNEFAGAIWKFSAAGKFTVLHDFTAATDGADPNGPLVLARDGNLYGMTASGGADNFGTIFRITPTGTFTVLHVFENGNDGADPTGTLVSDGLDTLYGGTNSGQVFKILLPPNAH